MSAVAALARVEAVRHLRSWPVWTGLAVSVGMAVTMSTPDWQSGTYHLAPQLLAPLALGVFVSALLSGGRDHHLHHEPLAVAAPVEDGQRAVARVLALAPLVVLAAVVVAAVAIGARLEGGFWMGDEPGRIDDAQHTLPELLQPVLHVALAGAAGLAAGRAFRRTAPVAIVALVAFFVFGFIAWAWQWSPARYVAPVQIQPITVVAGPADADPSLFPDEWLLAEPTQYDPEWRRVIVSPALAAGHDLHLAGVAVLLAGAAIRGRIGRRLAVAGVVVAVVAVAAQVLVAPGSA